MNQATAVREKPILFSSPMILRLLDSVSPKTVTRRLVKWKPLAEGLNLSFSGLSAGHYCTDAPESGHVLYSRNGSGVWEQRTKPIRCPYGGPGDRLWVKETWAVEYGMRDIFGDGGGPAPAALWYRADGTDRFFLEQGDARIFEPDEWHAGTHEAEIQVKTLGRWRSSMFMPRWASRITLEVLSVSVERLQSITEADAIAEGATQRESGWSMDWSRVGTPSR